MNHFRHRAFTLVELLVVVGIISVLIAILLPALNRARESAKRVACGSNLRQTVLAMQLYAQDNRNAIPIGYWSGKQHNFLMYLNEPGFLTAPNAMHYPILGRLVQSGILKDPRVMYCPSETDSEWQYATPQNPFPPITSGFSYTYAGYGTRPEACWFNPSRVGDYSQYPSKNTDFPTQRMPRLQDLKRRAVVADIVAHQGFVIKRHKQGVNVGYADGHIQFVRYDPRERFTGTNYNFSSLINLIPYPPSGFTWSSAHDPVFLSYTTNPPQGIWIEFDKASP